MRFLILFFITMMGGTLFSCVYFKKRFEQGLPAAVLALVLTLYIFSVFGFLKPGAYFVVGVYLAAYPLSRYKIIRDKSFKETAINLFTPAALFFFAVMALYGMGFFGMVASGWDEFSHWGSCVKRMYYNHSLYTDPALGAGFQSYPPAMALLQYMGQFLAGKWGDWYLYLTYAFFSISLIMPFLSKTKFKQPVKAFFAFACVSFAVVFLFPNRFTSIYIDDFLAFISAFCFAYPLCFDCVSERFHRTVFSMGLAVLALTKDAGMLFAVFALISFVLIFIRETKGEPKDIRRRVMVGVSMPAAALAAAKISWKIHLAAQGSMIMFDGKYDPVEFIKILMGRDVGYKSSVADIFKANFFRANVRDGVRYTASYCVVFAVIALAAFALYRAGRSRAEYQKRIGTVLAVLSVSVSVYIVGMLASYIYKFIEYEAVRLASFDRYMSVAVCTAALVLLFFALQLAADINDKAAIGRLSAYMVLCIWGSEYGEKLIVGYYGEKSRSDMSYYIGMSREIASVARPEEKIAVICPEDNGFVKYALEYYLYPQKMVQGIPYSFSSESRLLYDGDIWSRYDYSPDNLREDLESRGVDIVIVKGATDRFIKEYSEVFENEEIPENGIYRFDKAAGELVLIK